jgi:putative pyruvate formate lyase activating enzyme
MCPVTAQPNPVVPDVLQLRERATIARTMLHCCELCEVRCRVDRTSGERGTCGLGDRTYSFKRHISFAEELALIPSYMVYFGGCNFRCSFCVQAPTCFVGHAGSHIHPVATAQDCIAMISKGAKTINLLGGEPTLHLHTILDIAASGAEEGVRLPLAINSNMFMTRPVLDLLEGVATLYIADYKFGNDECALRLARISNYTAIAQRNILLAAKTTPLLLRHLVMPGHIECCLRPFAAWMAEHMPTTPVTLMLGYVPAYRSTNDPSLNRTLTLEETTAAQRVVREYGLVEAA